MRAVHHAHAAAADDRADLVAIAELSRRQVGEIEAGDLHLPGVARRFDLASQMMHLIQQSRFARLDLPGHPVEHAGQATQLVRAPGDAAQLARLIGAGLDGRRRRDHTVHLLEVLLLLIPEPLLLEARRDTCPQEHRVERLGKKILGAALDAPDDVGHVVRGGDHDDGNVPRGRVVLDVAQRLEPVQLRHHDVQQHEVERLGGDQVQRAAPVLGVHDGISLTLEPPPQHVAILLQVVHHENAAGPARQRRRRIAARAVARCRRCFVRGFWFAPQGFQHAEPIGGLENLAHVTGESIVSLRRDGFEDIPERIEDARAGLREGIVQGRQLFGADRRLARGRERLVDDHERVARGAQRGGEALLPVGVSHIFHILEQHLGVAHDVVHRRAQLVAQLRDAGQALRWCESGVGHSALASKASIFDRRRGSSIGLVS